MTTATPSKRKDAGSRVSTTKAKTIIMGNPYQLLSASKQEELDSIDSQIAKVTSSKEEAIAFLKRAGIMDKRGGLAKAYRPA